MCIDQSGDFVGMFVGKVVLSASNHMQSCVTKTSGERFSNGDRTQWIGVSPQQQSWSFDQVKLLGQIDAIGAKPIRECRVAFANLWSPVGCAKLRCIQAAGSDSEDQVSYVLRPRERRPDSEHATHGLSDQCSWLIDAIDDAVCKVIEIRNGWVGRRGSEPRISNDQLCRWAREAPRNGLPEISDAERARKKQQLCGVRRDSSQTLSFTPLRLCRCLQAKSTPQKQGTASVESRR